MGGQSWRYGDGQTLCRQWDGCRAPQGSAWGWKGRRRVQRDLWLQAEEKHLSGVWGALAGKSVSLCQDEVPQLGSEQTFSQGWLGMGQIWTLSTRSSGLTGWGRGRSREGQRWDELSILLCALLGLPSPPDGRRLC